MPLKPSAQRVQDLLAARGLDLTVSEMPDSTRTSEEAAAACGCAVAQIGKSLVFRARESGRPVLVVASGRSEEHTSELQSLMRISYAVFCLKKKKKQNREKT